MRVAVAAATPALRAGLRAMLGPGFLAADEHDSADVLVLADDDLLEGGPGVGEPGPALVVLSDDDKTASVLAALEPPGWALVPPDATAEELRAAVAAAASGLAAMPADLASRLARPEAPDEPPEDGGEPLTPREREVLSQLALGLSNKRIARELSISEHTVKFHVSSVLAKLGAVSRADALSRGLRRGLISL